ncbi:MAG: hypothetical protein JJU32_06505 [Phormidium sp. BM_Day4_Bin.17]|nr:hypothetical protein [Phormidium sp. BM_Day4_Bin.17]UCJ12569.1 MAG: hypothetical protein JWS08_01720 [Phormidium sp. PBR-2020]
MNLYYITCGIYGVRPGKLPDISRLPVSKTGDRPLLRAVQPPGLRVVVACGVQMGPEELSDRL